MAFYSVFSIGSGGPKSVSFGVCVLFALPVVWISGPGTLGSVEVGRDFCQWEDGWNFPNIVVAETKVTPRKPRLRGPQGGVNSGHCFPLRKGFCLSVNSQIISYWKNRLRHVVVEIAQVE